MISPWLAGAGMSYTLMARPREIAKNPRNMTTPEEIKAFRVANRAASGNVYVRSLGDKVEIRLETKADMKLAASALKSNGFKIL